MRKLRPKRQKMRPKHQKIKLTRRKLRPKRPQPRFRRSHVWCRHGAKTLKNHGQPSRKIIKIDDLLILPKFKTLYKLAIANCTIANFMYSTSWPKKFKFEIHNSTWLGLVWLGLGLVWLGFG